MAANLELFKTEHAATTSCGLGVERTLTAGDVLKLELGDDELLEVVPEGETWNVRVSIHVGVT